MKKPFVLKNMQRIEDTPVHKAIREAFVNMIIHADYRMDAGVLKVVKFSNGFQFSNPGNLKLPKEQIYKGGDSKARNPHMQTMLRLIGFGDNAGSGFPDILKVWSDNGWEVPELIEHTVMNQVTLTLKYHTVRSENDTIDYTKIIQETMMNERSLVGEELKYGKNERSLSEEKAEQEKNERSLSEKMSDVLQTNDYRKVEKIIRYLEEHECITPQIAEDITGKSAATVRRYLKLLVGTGFVRAEGSTSNIKYII